MEYSSPILEVVRLYGDDVRTDDDDVISKSCEGESCVVVPPFGVSDYTTLNPAALQ
ncbi:hypothetical protein [Bifidobacterium leontopitheci]|uniref:Uncharacterized protein n=1 Tax=Bifidobacterium leontopitheci TaxID=2650774 RepID=A0A6I1GCY3_9BIFI|nr:hypothetical protein [Bifidobacterium leontopitheci]KAB7789510.1 hypothetical protein F7D09_1979 [Bifidobacterium leontopitheci]